MQFGYRDVCLDHDTGPRHPETADRLRAIRRALSREHGVEYVDPETASRDAIERVHEPAYVTEVETFCADGGGSWDADTVAVEATWDAALAAAGGARWAAEAALDGADGRETPFSICRPPGHHAEAADAMGFCFFNNVAVAAEAALTRVGVDRVAVFDWDVHHGNGTQDVFYDRGDVFYASIHERGLFPGTGEVTETGTEEGDGTTLNVSYRGGAGDPAYLAAVDEAIAPALERFAPDLLLISAGFDAHRNDPISRMRVSTDGYGALAARMRALADRTDAGLGFVLEGGYGLDALAESIVVLNETFAGYEPAPEEGTPESAAREVLDDVREQHGV
jgi:acetoin utilization deacetylase AcuC-like enzyme